MMVRLYKRLLNHTVGASSGSHIIRITCTCNIFLPYTPLLYSKTGVYRGIPNFLIFDQKHTLWVHVLVKTALARRF